MKISADLFSLIYVRSSIPSGCRTDLAGERCVEAVGGCVMTLQRPVCAVQKVKGGVVLYQSTLPRPIYYEQLRILKILEPDKGAREAVSMVKSTR